MGMRLFHVLFAPGFFTSAPVGNALLMGTVVSVVSAIVGVFVVIRAQSYLGHALGDFGATGASVSFLIGLNALWGFLGGGLVAGTSTTAFGHQEAHRRDVTTGIVHALVMGLGALFLYLDTTYTSVTGAPMAILFGSVFLVNPALAPTILGLGLLTLLMMLVLFRPLLFCSLHPELARTRRVPVRLIGLLFVCCMAMAVSQASMVVGAMMSTALLIGPAATAIRLTTRIGYTLLLAVGIGLLATWIGIVLAYDSYIWPPHGHGWPVSFFVASVILLFYISCRVWICRRHIAVHRMARVTGGLMHE